MKFKKLLLTIILVIPVMGYCGFIDWITGYPEVKAKIEKRLEQKYHGDKFEVWDVSYSSNLGGYNFKAKDLSYEDLESGGSYYEKENQVVDNFGNAKQAMDWKALFRPYVDAVTKNNVIRSSIDGANPVGGQNQKPITEMRKTLAVLFNNNISMKEKIKQRHNYIVVYNTIYVDVAKTPEGMLKVLQMIDNLNNYYRSLDLYSYELEVVPYDLPKGLTFSQYLDNAVEKDSYYGWNDFEKDENIQKYAWGWIKIYGCAKSPNVKKICNNYKIYKNMRPTDKFDVELIKERTTADRIHNITDIAKEFHLFDHPGKPSIWSAKAMTPYVWSGLNVDYTPLIDTKLYKQVLKLENK